MMMVPAIKNGAACSRNSPQVLSTTMAKLKAAWIGLRCESIKPPNIPDYFEEKPAEATASEPEALPAPAEHEALPAPAEHAALPAPAEHAALPEPAAAPVAEPAAAHDPVAPKP